MGKEVENDLKLNPFKYNLFRWEVNLGHVISAENARTNPEKISAVVNLNSPENVHQL